MGLVECGKGQQRRSKGIWPTLQLSIGCAFETTNDFWHRYVGND